MSVVAPAVITLALHGTAPPSLADESPSVQHTTETQQKQPVPWFHLGQLRIRDLTVFGILRLDFLPAHAVTARPGTWAFEVNLSYQNTYVLSKNVADYVRAKGGGGRVALDASGVPGILAAGDEVYLVDGELGVFDLTLHYRFSPHWGGYVTIPALIFQAGVLDGTIESFHNLVGLGDEDRNLVERNRFFVVSKTRDGTIVLTEPPRDGFADPVFGARFSLIPAPKKWNVILEAAVKPAFREARVFLSSGNSDYGIQVSFQRFFQRQALYWSLSAVEYGGVNLEGVSNEAQLVPTAIMAWEFRMSRTLNGILQLYTSPSVVRNTDLDELRV